MWLAGAAQSSVGSWELSTEVWAERVNPKHSESEPRRNEEACSTIQGQTNLWSGDCGMLLDRNGQASTYEYKAGKEIEGVSGPYRIPLKTACVQ